jgi:YVTN family beta-propeller protein
MKKTSIAFAVSLIFFWSTFLGATEPNTVVATIPVGINPAGIAITPDSLYAYVANNNNSTSVYSVSVLNLTNNSVVTTISDSSFNQPYSITINASGTKAYVANSNASTVTIIDINTNTVIGTIPGFDGPSGFVITPDGNHAYVNNYGGPIAGSGNGTTVSVVNLNTNLIIDTITVGQAPAALAITPDGAYVYVVNYVDGNLGTGTISIIRTSDNSVRANAITDFSGPYAIAITPDGNYAYVTNFGSNDFTPVGTTVSVVDINSNAITATILLGIQPAGVAITPNGLFAYVSNYSTLYNGAGFTDLTSAQGAVDIIDIQTNTTIAPIIGVGLAPDQIAISPNGQFAYVSNYSSDTVTVIALPSFLIAAQGCRTKNQFLSQTDWVNQLSWTVSGAALPLYYSIYRNADLTDLVATVGPARPFVYYDHNTNPSVSYTYYITGTNAYGNTSDPVEVTISQNCEQ